MKATIKNAKEILDKGGVIKVSDWTTGSGRYVSKRPIPAFCCEIEKGKLYRLTGEVAQKVNQFAENNPRVKKFIYVSDKDGLEKAIENAGSKAKTA